MPCPFYAKEEIKLRIVFVGGKLRALVWEVGRVHKLLYISRLWKKRKELL